MISMRRLTFVLPVPVTALSQIVAADMQSMPSETIRMTGTASAINVLSRPKTSKNNPGKIFTMRQRKAVNDRLSQTIFLIREMTWSCFP